MKEVIDVNVSFDTSFEEIELLRLEMEKFVRAPENNRDFQPDVGISVGGVGELDKLTLKVAIKHKSNWHNDMVRATRRSKFMCALTLALKLVPINGPGGGGDALGGPANPQYAVTVTDDFAEQAREKSEKDKESKKLGNKKPDDSDDGDDAKATEVRAAQNLNTTDPVTEALEDWGYENTLNSRAPSTTRRANDVEGRMSIDSMRGTASMRGRRIPGTTVTKLYSEGASDTPRMPAAPASRDPMSFDLERNAGLAGPSGEGLAHYASDPSTTQGSQRPPARSASNPMGGHYQATYPAQYGQPTTGVSNMEAQTEPMARVRTSLGRRPVGGSLSSSSPTDPRQPPGPPGRR